MIHLAQVAVGVVTLLASCGRVTRLYFNPTPVSTDTTVAQRHATPVEALAAVERLAVRFGLAPRPGDLGECAGAWLARNYDGGRVQQLHICALPAPDGGLQVVVTEFVGWSPRSDSLRYALADTLARFGTVRRQ